MAVKSIDLGWIVVSNFEKAIKFYTEVVGLKLLTKEQNYKWAELGGEEGGALLGISEACEHTPISAGANAILTLTVDNLETTKAALGDKGVHFHGEIMEVPGIVKMQLFSDADKNYFQLVESLEGHITKKSS